jgi:Asp-tRNA(Asn)/Glu-tRNA(Gln) amidotransferase A subunit family amidase
VQDLKNLNLLSAVEAARLLADRTVSAEDMVRACLERIEEIESEVGAWIYLNQEQALAAARALDRGSFQGPLHGLPVGVKDIFDTFDMPTSYGSPIYENHTPPWDAACVAITRGAGGIILGKTVTTEFATYRPGNTSNPRNTRYTPGGSSSGSAAAVAACMTPLAFGTQTAGSVIRPAAFCGIVGYKPSFGSIPVAGTKLIAESLDTIGLFARNVADVSLFAKAVTGRTNLMVTGSDSVSNPRVGICRTFEWEYAQKETEEALINVQRLLEASGAKVCDVALPPDFALLAIAQSEIMAFEAARSLIYEYQAHRENLSTELQDLIQNGFSIEPERYDEQKALAQKCRIKCSDLFSEVDILVAPSTPGEAPFGKESTGNPVFNRVWTLLGTPCVHLPCMQGPNGLPVGVQAIGEYCSDAKTLHHANWVFEMLNSH